MGQAQSGAYMAAVGMSPEMQTKMTFFSTIFSRLIEKSDIVDLKALTAGPGACGNYVMLLSKNLHSDFKQIKLQSGFSESSLNDFLYSPVQKIVSKTSAKETACTYLAIFYIRTLQLVAALTMSIYSPADLIARISRKVYENALKLEKKTHPMNLTKTEKAERKQKREAWLQRFLTDTEQPGTFILNNNEQFKYNKVTATLKYISSEPLEYRLRLEVLDPDTYSVEASLITPDTYWIEITNYYIQLKDREVIYRVLVNGTGKGWVFKPVPETELIEEEFLLGPYENWAHDLEQFILDSTIVGEKPVLKNNTGFGMPRLSKFFNQSKRVNSKSIVSRNITRNNKPIPKNTIVPIISEKSQLPVRYQSSYKTMVNWWGSVKLPDWPEAAPASFRATLLYNKPTMPTAAGSTYVCDDIWAGKNLRTIPPFAALEALYFNRDDGTADPNNAEQLAALTNAFNIIYDNPVRGNVIRAKGATKAAANFMDIYIPVESAPIRNLLCRNTSAQGESQISPEYAVILQKAQIDIVTKYKAHVEAAYDILKQMFELVTVDSNTTIKFTDSFVNSPKGVRNVLEMDIIPLARRLIANHYIDTETIYYNALSEILNRRI